MSYEFPATLGVESVHKTCQTIDPIVVTLVNVANYADIDLSNAALAAAGETRGRIHQITVLRDAYEDIATVKLYRD